MLYIWPYITFFSFPLLYPYILNTLLPQSLIPHPLRTGSTHHLIPRARITIPFLAAMLATVHFNTLVHPFTLADNRHYTFYVFRLLRRHWTVKYLVVPIYYLCGWAAIVALGGFPDGTSSDPPHNVAVKNTKKPTTAATARSPAPGTRVSFSLVFLLTTTLALTTAPLVEPRYFILPWLIWRLHIPVSTPQSSKPLQRKRSRGWVKALKVGLYERHDHRLWIESLWFLLVNAVTGYVFLHWRFHWAQEPGVVQRFMW